MVFCLGRVFEMSDDNNQQNGFELHGINHMSASSINKGREAFDAWIVHYLFNERFSFGWAALLGTCVEHGINLVKFKGVEDGKAHEEAQNKMIHESKLFDDRGEKLNKYMPLLEKMFKRGLEELEPFGPPTPVIHDADVPEYFKDQHKIEVPVRFGKAKNQVVPVIGFLDYYYADRDIPLIIDLKTTSKAPSKWSLNHGTQAALYKVAMEKMTGKEHEVRFLYCLTRQKDDFLWLTMDNPDYYIGKMKSTIAQMETYLSLSADKEKLLQACVHNPDSFYWSGSEEISRKYYGQI